MPQILPINNIFIFRMNWDDLDDKSSEEHDDKPFTKQKSQEKGNYGYKAVATPFNPRDPKQKYYQEDQVLHEKSELLTKFGWKVRDLERQEEELTLQCCHLLEAQLNYPIKFFTNLLHPSEDREDQQTQIKSLWMETTLHRLSQTRNFNPRDRSSSYSKIFQIYENKLLPSLVNFIQNHIKWEPLIKNGKNTQQILSIFHDEVVLKMNDLVATQFRHNDR